MSAFVVSEECILDVLNVVKAFYSTYCWIVPKMKASNTDDDAKADKNLNAFGNQIMKLNIKSFNYRYDEKVKHHKINWEKIEAKKDKTSILRAIKQLHCIIYQSCEFPNCDKDWRMIALERIKGLLCDNIVSNTEEYQNISTWG